MLLLKRKYFFVHRFMQFIHFSPLFRLKMSKNVHTGHSTSMSSSYKDAIKKLRDLQSNSAYITIAEKSSTIPYFAKLSDTKKYLIRSGITMEQVDNLSIIHVAGTKGKGSVCAFTEAILREHKFRTGFFSSPHLVSVRERIRINGSAINETDFVYYFWELYRKLENAKEHESDMPSYFKFLTVLMFNIFVQENIDVAIIEVGIGGELDCTNIIRNPVCVGITSLGLDHTSLLGNTIEEIAYQKSGIFKPSTIAFTVPQSKEVLQILTKRAMEKQCTLHIIPSFQDYKWGNNMINNKVLNRIQQENASLAIQLAIQWMRSHSDQNYFLTINGNVPDQKPYKIQEENIESRISNVHITKQELTHEKDNTSYVSLKKIAAALSSCAWPGRIQILKGTSMDFYLDGAHTLESMNCCISWFKNQIKETNGKRYLIFNMIGKRDASLFVSSLKAIQFHKVYFVPNLSGIPDVDEITTAASINEQKIRCQHYCELWGEHSVVANNIMEILNDIKTEHVYDETICKDRAQILITGSLHLVGAALAVLDPDLTMTTTF